MKRLTILFAVMLCVATASAQKFSYSFNHTPLADALMQIAEQHPTFISTSFTTNSINILLRQLYIQMMPTICSGKSSTTARGVLMSLFRGLSSSFRYGKLQIHIQTGLGQ